MNMQYEELVFNLIFPRKVNYLGRFRNTALCLAVGSRIGQAYVMLAYFHG